MKNKVVHWFAALVVMGGPILAFVPGSWKEVTIGAVLNGLYLWASQVMKPTTPSA